MLEFCEINGYKAETILKSLMNRQLFTYSLTFFHQMQLWKQISQLEHLNTETTRFIYWKNSECWLLTQI